MHRDESYIMKRLMSMNIDGHPSRGRLKKRWMDCVKVYMGIKGVGMKMTIEENGRRKHVVPTPFSGIKI
jgi:hypothetical protein